MLSQSPLHTTQHLVATSATIVAGHTKNLACKAATSVLHTTKILTQSLPQSVRALQKSCRPIYHHRCLTQQKPWRQSATIAIGLTRKTSHRTLSIKMCYKSWLGSTPTCKEISWLPTHTPINEVSHVQKQCIALAFFHCTGDAPLHGKSLCATNKSDSLIPPKYTCNITEITPLHIVFDAHCYLLSRQKNACSKSGVNLLLHLFLVSMIACVLQKVQACSTSKGWQKPTCWWWPAKSFLDRKVGEQTQKADEPKGKSRTQ